MTRIETAEQAEVWLATYRAELRFCTTSRAAIEVADAAVEAWRERAGSAEKPREEADLLRTQRDSARKQLEDVRVALKAFQRPDASLAQAAEHLVNAHGILRDETDAIFEALPPGEGTLVERVKRVMADLRSKLAAVNDMHDNAVSAQDRLIAELREALEAGRQLLGVVDMLDSSNFRAKTRELIERARCAIARKEPT